MCERCQQCKRAIIGILYTFVIVGSRVNELLSFLKDLFSQMDIAILLPVHVHKKKFLCWFIQVLANIGKNVQNSYIYLE